MGAYECYIFGTAGLGRECALEELAHSVAYKETVGIGGMRRKSTSHQSPIDRLCQVGNGIEQCSVEVEDYELFHIGKKIGFSGEGHHTTGHSAPTNIGKKNERPDNSTAVRPLWSTIYRTSHKVLHDKRDKL